MSALTSGIEKAMLDQQRRQIGPFADSLNKVAPARTTTAFGGYFYNNWNSITTFFTQTIPEFFQPPYTSFKIAIYCFIALLILIGLIFLYNYYKKSTSTTISTTNNSPAIVNKLTGTAGFSNPISRATKLLNLQPITIKQAGYLGNGIFNEDDGIKKQLMLGIRHFFLQIDYLETDSLSSNEFPKKNVPILLMRDEKGILTSKNSGDLEKIMTALATYGMNETFPNSTDPIFIYLHFVKIPSLLSEPDEYKKYVNTVADSMAPIQSLFLTGGYYKSQKEKEIFQGTIEPLEGRFVIGTNIDTSIIDNKLNTYINFHYYSHETDKATMKLPNNNTLSPVVFSTNYLLKLSDNEKISWVKENKSRYTIALSPLSNNPSSDDINVLLNELGVNCIPYDYFASDMNESKKVKDKYNNSWKLKPDFLQMKE